ncbi:chromosome segregation protein SMC [Synechococcus elongatus]|uniref:Chromosome partition protein Smc n=1 Tax=Synechococcus elongatus PCC 11802 TaxID=2283154 RepID=A0AAT9K0I3_SYNEL|nr:chromosome segregation protein SMC [Synechococcus elongatus]QFZ92043.1 chromosome segregation protein SMC [Synechococcus elongatus PCC 11802]
MVYIKQIELSHFKSFGGTTSLPLLPEFTVVTGPNGSGKSNILDALLFALGLSSSKGMRADRLPDLVNSTYASRSRSTVETLVSVTFALDDWQPEAEETEEEEGTGIQSGMAEWTVSRKLRVTPSGTYTSTYAMNGEACTLQQLHEQLSRLRIYPEGYNVVLQGDVTNIISMSPRDRRQIIDELAGVAQFDRKIEQAKGKLDSVKEREDRCRIVEQELIEQRDRLAKDREKAQKYQALRQEQATKQIWEAVLRWRAGQQQVQTLQRSLTQLATDAATDQQTQQTLEQQIQQTEVTLESLNQRVKALGEEELLKLQAALAQQEAEQRQSQRQQQELVEAQTQTQQQIQALLQAQTQLQTEGQQQAQQAQILQTAIAQTLQPQYQQALEQVEAARQAAHALAAQSQDWVTRQTSLRQQADAIAAQVEPQRAEQAQLQERQTQLQQQLEATQAALVTVTAELETETKQAEGDRAALSQAEAAVVTAADQLVRLEEELQIQQETRDRLLKEQREKQRQLDRQESLRQALQETQGTAAARMILETGLPGVHGLVAQLGRVEPRYQVALEVAAGGRLGYLVVDDDSVAAAGIELLKQKKAGRITFLPLNRIRAGKQPEIPRWQQPEGLVDLAIALVDCDDRYREVFKFVLGGTVVFERLDQARRYMGQYRIVTLDGELLETSGAMTGGSLSRRSGGLSFGSPDSGESAEVRAIRDRLEQLEVILDRSELQILNLQAAIKDAASALSDRRQQQREQQLTVQQRQQTLQRLQQQQQQLRAELQQRQQQASHAQARLEALAVELPAALEQLQVLRQALVELEDSPIHGEWQQRQTILQQQEALLQHQETALRQAEQQLQQLQTDQKRLQERTTAAQTQVRQLRQQQAEQLNRLAQIDEQQRQQATAIAQLQQRQAQLEAQLGQEKVDRDRAERQLQEQRSQRQNLVWQQEKRQQQQLELQQQLTELETQLQAQQQELPQPLPEIPEAVQQQGMEALQHELRSLAKRIQAMEPVNMLALEEYERTQARLEELSEKLTTIEAERTELLLRIENFTTLRRRAFMESFEAIDRNFQEIFAHLSDGDGSLQLDNPEDPFSSGLNLIAHPKGKPVRRLASMSGGEKSLTALSFIFALQRYRPSPFYALDEVDSFLDGANVERLARVIRQQAQAAQFIVVSHRRPMIEAAERTIGVTQARGAHTQVLGIPQP